MKNLEVTLEKARQWYETGNELRTLALSLYTEQELKKKEFFKKGDYVVSLTGIITIVNKCGTEGLVFYDAFLRPGENYPKIKKDYGVGCCNDNRYATPCERKRMDEALAKIDKRYNQETKQFEDILKVGDLVIAWDNKSNAIIGKITNIKEDRSYPYIIYYRECFKHAVKWNGTKEQYEKIVNEQ